MLMGRIYLIIPYYGSFPTNFQQYLDSEFKVIKIQTIKPRRIALPVFGASHVLEAGAGTFENWGLVIGHTLEARLT